MSIVDIGSVLSYNRDMENTKQCSHAGVMSRDECPYCNPIVVITDTDRMDWFQRHFPTLFGGYSAADAEPLRVTIDRRLRAEIR